MKDPTADWDREEREGLDDFSAELRALRERHAADPPIDVLRAAREDAVPAEARDRALHHLEHSRWSRTLADGLDQLTPELTAEDADRLLHRIRGRTRTAAAPARFLRWRDALAFAGLAAVVTLAVQLPTWRTAPPAAGPTTTPSASAAAAPEPPAMVLALTKPELKLSFSALQWRGSAGDNPLITDLAPGFDAFRRDDFAETARRLEPLAQKHVGSVEVFFYLGVSRLMQNDLPGARRALETALGVADQAFAPDVAWYLAIAEERSGDRASARARLDRICREGGPRAADACEGARRLP
jgi:hypothetical protein